MCDEDFCSEPAIIVVAVDGINDKPPMISVRPVGRVSFATCIPTLGFVSMYCTHNHIPGADPVKVELRALSPTILCLKCVALAF